MPGRSVNLRPGAINSASEITGRPSTSAARMRFAVHGPALELNCAVPSMGPQVRRLLGPFAVADWPDGFVPIHGVVRPYEESEVLRHLSPTARALPRTPELFELYEDGERFWV